MPEIPDAANTALLTGRDAPRPEPLTLRAGPLSMTFEPDIGWLRYIRLGDTEIVRAVYGAVRDERWATIEPELTNLQTQVAEDSFSLTFDARCRKGDVDFTWRGGITGEADGSVTFLFSGEANSTFKRNRIGLCVLHPIEGCAGRPVRVEHTDGTTEEGRFPLRISPHQPFKDIRAIIHEAAPGTEATVRFDGEVFEMEDQRNWTDASYKTYSTPLELPMPVTVEAGTKITQAVTVSVSSASAAEGTPAVVHPQERIAEPLSMNALPLLGLMLGEEVLSDAAVERLRVLRLAHLRVELRLAGPDWISRLETATQAAAKLGAKLEIVVTVSNLAAGEMANLRRAVDVLKPPVARWLVLHEGDPSTTDDQWVHRARLTLGSYAKDVPFGGGTAANFTEMNRNAPPVKFLDFLSFPITPQVHAFDDTSVMENLEGQEHTVLSAPPGDDPLYIGPITLRPRRRRVIGEGEDATGDPRQKALFAAAWTLGSISRLSRHQRVSGLTYFETSGPDGILEAEGPVYPVYHVFADLADAPGKWVHPVPLVGKATRLFLSGLLLSESTMISAPGKGDRVLIANTSPQTQSVELELPDTGVAFVKLLDETTAERAMNEPEAWRAEAGEAVPVSSGRLPVTLRPYAAARIDMDREGPV